MALSSRTGKIGSHQLICWAGALYQASRCHGKARRCPRSGGRTETTSAASARRSACAGSNPASAMIARTSSRERSAWMKRGFHSPRILAISGGLDVLVHVLRVVRPEQLGELIANVVDELAERAQAGQHDQVPGVGCCRSSSRGMAGSIKMVRHLLPSFLRCSRLRMTKDHELRAGERLGVARPALHAAQPG